MQAFQSTQLRGVLVVLAAVSHVAAQAPASIASAALVRSTPEREGISSAAILRFVAAADSAIDGMNSVMIVRHGQVVGRKAGGLRTKRRRRT